VIHDALEKLLVDSAYRDAARRLGAEIEGRPAPADVVPALLELAG
jgi:UDP:flavonoid glycosyltransferase YjiC (YdhE family)